MSYATRVLFTRLGVYAVVALLVPMTVQAHDAFVELAMEAGCETFAEVKKLETERKEQVCAQMREDGAFIEAGENDNVIVQRLQKEPNAYGIFGFRFLDQNRDKIQGNAIDGSAPTFDTIASGKYPVSRPLHFYVKNAHVGVIPGMEAYIAEFTSSQAWGSYGYLLDKGLIPPPEDQREEMSKRAQSLNPLELSSL